VVRYRAILFDWDGTLIESLPLKIANAADLFAETFDAEPQAVRTAYGRYSGVGRRQLFDEIARDCIGRSFTDVEFAGLSAAFTERNRQVIMKHGVLRPGALESLETLKEAGLYLGISTSAAQDEMEPLARHFGVAKFCDLLLGSRPGFAKGPDHVRYVSAHLNLANSDLAGVGDDERDMELFAAAGIARVGITGTHTREALFARGAQVVIDQLIEVVAIALSHEHHR
jgi:phosphoglycolate phosphatase